MREGYHLARTLSALRMGAYDPSFRIEAPRAILARQTPDGPVSVAIEPHENTVRASIYGPGADWMAPRLHGLCGLDDAPELFEPRDAVVSRLWRKFSGMHLPRTPLVYDRVVQIVLLQLVTWVEACRGWGRLVRAKGAPAPGPFDLFVPPSAETLAATAVFELTAMGIRPKQGQTIQRLAKRAARLERAASDGVERFSDMLAHLPGIGPWTIAYARGSALGDPDAVLLGDYGLPHSVAYVLAREARGSDDRMLELLEPYRGHRFRVIRLIWSNGVFAPRRGPRGGGE